MTAGGFSALPSAEDDAHDGSEWRGVSRIVGPAWAKLPALTLGLLGVQTLWSIEMAYGMVTRVCIISSCLTVD
jgi:solute carrier family 45, member 1/2/4